MTKDTDEFLQFAEPVTCRDFTLPRDDNQLTRKVGFKGKPKLDPCWKSQPVTCKANKHGVEIRIESVNKDHSHSWVRISHGLNKLVKDLIDKEYDDNEQETSETKRGVFAQMCVAPFAAWRPRSRPQWSTSEVDHAHLDGFGAASPGWDTNTGCCCAASAATR